MENPVAYRWHRTRRNGGMALFQKKENMKMTNKVMAKWFLILLGMTMGIDCLGSRIVSMIYVQMRKIELRINEL